MVEQVKNIDRQSHRARIGQQGSEPKTSVESKKTLSEKCIAADSKWPISQRIAIMIGIEPCQNIVSKSGVEGERTQQVRVTHQVQKETAFPWP